MKPVFGILVLAILFSCNKSDAITDVLPSAVADSAQVIYVNTSSVANVSLLLAFKANGQKKWEYGNIRPISFWSMPAYSDNKLFMASDLQMLCINAESGANIWTYNGSAHMVHPKLQGDTLITAASLIAPSTLNMLLLLNKNSGSVIWSKAVSDQPMVPPVLSEGKIYSLTTNGTGTAITLSVYDLQTKNLVWQKAIAAGFLMSLPPDMAVRNDTLLVGSFTGQVTLLNKNTGAVYWSKSFQTDQSFIYNNEIVYNDNATGRVTKVSLQTGAVTMQMAPVHFTVSGGGLSYIYDNTFYYRKYDSLFCTSLIDGTLKRSKMAPGYYTKCIVIGQTVYAAKIDYSLNNESRIMVLNPKDFSVKDSIKIPAQNITNFSALSTANKFY